MILNIWKPIYKTIDGVKSVHHYEIIDDLNEIKKGWKVSYICDRCNSNKINSTTSTVLLNPDVVYNSLEYQTCRSCRSYISEYEIKKNFILYDVIEQSIIKDGYRILSDEDDYNISKNKSQYKLRLICPNNHHLTSTWNNWSRGRRCRKCYDNIKLVNAVKYKEGWDLYKFNVWRYTEKTYKENYSSINPKNFKRGEDYHLDHKFSISEGFLQGVLPSIIGGVVNLEILTSYDNNSKGRKCSLPIDKILR
jgi:hypothetical protein